MAYDTFYLGWADETTHGTSLVTGAGDTAYKFGSTTDNTPLPDPNWQFLREVPDWGERKTSNLLKTVPTVTTSAFAFLPNNAVPCYWALGKSSTAATVHTITAQSQASGTIAQLPSLTFHAERLDSAAVLTDWVTQYTGMRNLATRFFCGDDDPELTCVMAWLGLKATDQAFALTTKPANVTGTHTSPIHYLWPGCTHKYDSTTIEGVTHWEIAIENGTHTVPGDYGSKWPSAVYQGRHQQITLTVRYRPQVETLHADLLATTVPAGKDWEFEFVRDATDDKLKFTCSTTSTVVHPVPHPNTAGEFEVELTAIVTNLTVTATDQINATFYGE
jgi:hypothetical protein